MVEMKEEMAQRIRVYIAPGGATTISHEGASVETLQYVAAVRGVMQYLKREQEAAEQAGDQQRAVTLQAVSHDVSRLITHGSLEEAGLKARYGALAEVFRVAAATIKDPTKEEPEAEE